MQIFLIKMLRLFLFYIGFPMLKICGKFSKKHKDNFENLFIESNNWIIKKITPNKTNRILILLPHCLQFDDCKHKITKDLDNCTACGTCTIKDFLDLEKEFNIKIKIATGGSIARKIIKDVRPDFIIACACEQDLSSGIYDSFPVHVWGIINERPNGPCINTTVDFALLRNALKDFYKVTSS